MTLKAGASTCVCTRVFAVMRRTEQGLSELLSCRLGSCLQPNSLLATQHRLVTPRFHPCLIVSWFGLIIVGKWKPSRLVECLPGASYSLFGVSLFFAGLLLRVHPKDILFHWKPQEQKKDSQAFSNLFPCLYQYTREHKATIYSKAFFPNS